jgi:hypothetical protein
VYRPGIVVGRIVLALKVAAGAVAFGVYVWFAAVRNAGRVKRRTAARRRARRAGRAAS